MRKGILIMKPSFKSGNFQKARLHYPFNLFLIFSLSVIIIAASNYKLVRADDLSPNWFYNVNSNMALNLNPENTKWLVLNGRLVAITLDQGQLLVYNQAQHSNWIETQALKPSEATFTSFVISVINPVDPPEIIAGTSEPGYIYIYKLEKGIWTLQNSEKYIWSTITSISTGYFDSQQFYLLVQNQNGYLYLLKLTKDSLDIVWKSPTVWRLINSSLVLDIDKDSKEEIVVSYKTGGIGILKLINNQIVSVWDNFLWGKILALTEGDWDNDKQPEILISTSQKVIYGIGYNGKNYQFKDQITQFNYIAETLSFTNFQNHNQLITTDTAGKFHFSEYNLLQKQWQEQFFCKVGRIAQIIKTDNPDSILLWSQNHELIILNTFKTSDFKLKNENVVSELKPPAIYQNNNLYIAPKALNFLKEKLEISYSETKNTYLFSQGQTTMVIAKTDLENYKLNGESNSNQNQYFMIYDNNLYLSQECYAKLFNITVLVDLTKKTISLNINNVPIKDTPTPNETGAN